MSELESNYDKDFQPRLPNGDIIDAKNTCASIDTGPDSQNDQHINHHIDEVSAVAATPINTTSTIVIPSDGVYPVENDVVFHHTPHDENINIRNKDTSSKNEPIVTSGSWFSKRNTYICLAILFVTTIGLIGFVVGTYSSKDSSRDSSSIFMDRPTTSPSEGSLSMTPTKSPISSPTSSPSNDITFTPSVSTDNTSTTIPTLTPSNITTATPTFIPSDITTITPTVSPTIIATNAPTISKEQIVVEFISNITLSNQPITLDGINAESLAVLWMIQNDTWIVDTPTAILAASLNSIQNSEIRFRIIQRYSLLTLWFQQEILLQQWRVTTGWLDEPNECVWYGLMCHTSLSIDNVGVNYTNVIGSIDFNDFTNVLGNNLVGSIPPDLGFLSHIVLFDVGLNRLTGTLPETIGFWTSLTLFHVGRNMLMGSLPNSIGDWSSLTFFSASNNIQLTGTIPESIFSWVELTEFYCANNSMTGFISESIGNWNLLSAFDVALSNFNGTLPDSIGSWSDVTFFHAFGNQLTGQLPEAIGQLTALTSFSVYRNSFTGTLPKSIGQLTALTSFSVSDNQFNGTIPESIGNWSNIVLAQFFNNQFTGSMPDSVCFSISSETDELSVDCGFPCSCCTVCV